MGSESGLDSEPKLLLAPKPPDGGWGWMVVFASFMTHLISDGVASSFGVFFSALMEDLKPVTEAEVAAVQSILYGTLCFLGPVAGALVNRYGNRPVAIAGSIMAGVGFAISFFAKELHSVHFLYFSVGLLGGGGMGLMYVPSIVSVSSYFEKKRALATGICMCSSGIGTMIFAPFSGFLVKRVGWPTTFIILGSLFVVCLAVSFFYRPLPYVSVPDDCYVDIEDDGEDEAVGAGEQVEESATDAANPPDQPMQSQNKKASVISSGSKYNRKASVTSSGSNKELEEQRSQDSVSSNKSTRSRKLRTSLLNQLQKRRKSSGPVLQRMDIFYGGNVAAVLNSPGGDQVTSSGSPRSARNSASSNASQGDQDKDNEKGQAEQEKGDKGKEDELVEEDNLIIYEDGGKKGCHDFVEALKTMTDMSLLKDPVFLLFAIANFFTWGGAYVPITLIVSFAQNEKVLPKSISDQHANLLLSIYGLTNTLSRLGSGYVSDKPWVSKWFLFYSSSILLGIATGLISHADQIHNPWVVLGLLQTYAALLGISCGIVASLSSVILVDLFGIEKLTNAFGLLLVFIAMALLIFPPIGGALYNVPKSAEYRTSFWLGGGFCIASGIAYFLIPSLKKARTRKSISSDSEKGALIETDPSEGNIGSAVNSEVSSI